jgi:hypothetical protein
MFTSAECRALAEQKLAQAERDDRHRRRLIAAAEGWLLLASKLREVEVSFSTDEFITTRRSKRSRRLPS